MHIYHDSSHNINGYNKNKTKLNQSLHRYHFLNFYFFFVWQNIRREQYM